MMDDDIIRIATLYYNFNAKIDIYGKFKYVLTDEYFNDKNIHDYSIRYDTVMEKYSHLIHRKNEPAIIYHSGRKEWWFNGQRHREDGPAIEHKNVTTKWYQHGELHRIDGPAVEWGKYSRAWYQHGELHRIDGPAVEWEDTDNEWYIKGCGVTDKIKEWAEYNNIGLDNLTDEDKLFLALEWSDYNGE